MKYRIIYADPPWKYMTPSKEFRALAPPYKCMPTRDICNMNVRSIAADDAVLFMWTADATLVDAMKVISAWGFEYSTVAFVWVKPFPMWGMWTLKQTEMCLLATRGKAFSTMRLGNSRSIRQLVLSPKGRHSAKPEEVKTRIVQMLGIQPRVELFARTRTPGWAVWGNEVDSDIPLICGA